MKAIKITPLFIVAIILVILTKNIFAFSIMYLTLMIHELVHLFFMCKNKIAVDKIVLEPFGISIIARSFEKNNTKSSLIFLSAPIFNIFLGISLYLYSYFTKQTYFSYFIITNITLGLFNLIPCLPFDGGKAIDFILTKKYGNIFASKIIYFISILISIFIIVFGVYILYLNHFNFSVFVIGIFILYNSISEKKLITNKVISRASNFNKDEIENFIPITNIAVSENYSAHKLLKEFSNNKYYIVNIIKKGEIVKTLTETQIINKLLDTNKCLKLKDY
jgi:stage IV sporulation protein FB